MSSAFFGLTIAGSGLNAFQASINTTANNVSNVDTEGYSRQHVEKTAASALRVFQKFGSTSTGVKADSVSRMRDQYYYDKFWSNQVDYGYYEKKSYYMDQIEDYFTDGGDANPGFSTIYGDMFDRLNEIATAAGDNSKRNSFVSSTEKLATYFNTTASRLEELQKTVNEEIKATVDQVNAMAQKIALINKQINILEMEGGQANDLRDTRALILDDLSKIVTIDTEELKVANSNNKDMYTGATTFKVKINGQNLVDNYEYNTLSTVTRSSRYNQSDADGMYDIVWTRTGNIFNATAKNQVGSLKSMIEMRDGNDEQAVNGYVTVGDILNKNYDGEGSNGARIVLTVPQVGDHPITAINDLNLPETGYVIVNNVRYEYDSWTAVVDTTQDPISKDKTYDISQIAFNLKERITADELGEISGLQATVGQSVDTKGIPYYQNQMNLFIRNFSEKFNDIQHIGQDLDEVGGKSFFVAESKTETENGKARVFDFSNLDETTKMEKTSVPVGERFLIGSSPENATDSSGKYVLGGITYDSTKTDNKYTNNTYYQMTAKNLEIASATVSNPQKLATTLKRDNGVDNNDLIPSMEALEHKTKLFRGGGGDEFLQCVYADITIDCEEARVFADNYKTIQASIQKQRDSVSGVDEDEEAMDLVRFQNAYNLNSKVISVLAEMYDQLILNTAP